MASMTNLVTVIVLVLLPTTLAQPAAAPAAKHVLNMTEILVRGGQFNSFLTLLSSTRILEQLQNQLNTTYNGMTIFAPTDAAFASLPAGTINNLPQQQQTELALAHGLPSAYTFGNFTSASNPVLTLAGGDYTVNITAPSDPNQHWVNVSTGVVEVHITNELNFTFPLAIYPVDKVLLPKVLSGSKLPPSTASPGSPASSGSPKPNAGGGTSPAGAPSNETPSTDKSHSGGVRVAAGSFGPWMAAGIGLLGFWVMGSGF